MFEVVDPMPGPVTLYGIRKGNGVTPWIEPGDKLVPAKLYRVVVGTHADAIKLMHGEYESTTWGIRILGFFLMWFGLSMTIAPIQRGALHRSDHRLRGAHAHEPRDVPNRPDFECNDDPLVDRRAPSADAARSDRADGRHVRARARLR